MPKPAVRKLIKSNEDWYPTTDGQVQVSFMELSTRQWRVCVWGGDDFGLERDYPHTERQEAKKLFNRLKDFTTQAKMKEWGMWHA